MWWIICASIVGLDLKLLQQNYKPVLCIHSLELNFTICKQQSAKTWHMHNNPQIGSFKRMCQRNRWAGPDLDMLGPYTVTNMGDPIKRENNYFNAKNNLNSITLQ
jgi:hypothetical protein